MARGVSNLLGYAKAGTDFLFGPLATPEIGGNSFAIAALPVIIFFASFIAILYHLGIMQRIVRWVGGGIGWITGISRVESLGSAANIFVGQSESPLVVRPYLATLRPAQLFTLMTVGMAGVAGTILAAYASLLGPQYLPYLLAAAFMSAPGGILMAKIIYPDGRPEEGELPLEGGLGADDEVDVAVGADLDAHQPGRQGLLEQPGHLEAADPQFSGDVDLGRALQVEPAGYGRHEHRVNGPVDARAGRAAASVGAHLIALI